LPNRIAKRSGRFREVDGDILFVYANTEELAGEMEDTFALHISIIASGVLKRQIETVIVHEPAVQTI
jgi:hypothetical protein